MSQNADLIFALAIGAGAATIGLQVVSPTGIYPEGIFKFTPAYASGPSRAEQTAALGPRPPDLAMKTALDNPQNKAAGSAATDVGALSASRH